MHLRAPPVQKDQLRATSGLERPPILVFLDNTTGIRRCTAVCTHADNNPLTTYLGSLLSSPLIWGYPTYSPPILVDPLLPSSTYDFNSSDHSTLAQIEKQNLPPTPLQPSSVHIILPHQSTSASMVTCGRYIPYLCFVPGAVAVPFTTIIWSRHN